VRDLEAELDLEQRRSRDAAAENKKLQKQLADLRMQAEDDHRTVAELSDQVTTLQMKIVTMKRQLDENVRNLNSLFNTYSGGGSRIYQWEGRTMASAELEPITGVWGRRPHWSPGTEPVLWVSGAKPP